MAVYFITGKLGAGKTLAAVGRIFAYLKQGRMVATNIDIHPHQVCSHFKRDISVTRLPDKPKLRDMEMLGSANKTYNEEKNGLIVLDECGTWFNSRNWNDKDRQPVINWFLHARKLGWDVIFIVQDISLVDKQAREALAEHVGYCRRLDRLSIPVISLLVKAVTGKMLRFPRIHFANIRYGDSHNALVVDRWFYRGSEFYKAYDTKQCFVDSDTGNYCVMSPWHTHGRYKEKRSIYSRVIKLLTNYTVYLILVSVRLLAGWTGRRPAHLAKHLSLHNIVKIRRTADGKSMPVPIAHLFDSAQQ